MGRGTAVGGSFSVLGAAGAAPFAVGAGPPPRSTGRLLLVDCNNVRGRGRSGRFDLSSSQFLSWLHRWTQTRAKEEHYKQVVATFDHGWHPALVALADLTVAFAGPKLLADDLIYGLSRQM
ncbi:UPF0652 protein, partial [Durusdinium trenchii]